MTVTTKKIEEVKRIAKRVSGIILFIEDKFHVFGPKGQPDPDTIHAIIDRGNGTVIGLIFPPNPNEYIIFSTVCKNIFYRLQPFV